MKKNDVKKCIMCDNYCGYYEYCEMDVLIEDIYYAEECDDYSSGINDTFI